jgi:hypothetical protein
MQSAELLKRSVNGVKGSFLIEDGEITDCDLEEELIRFLSLSIQFLTESFYESSRDLKRIFIDAEKVCVIFFYDVYILGIVASRDANLPLLEMVSHKLLLTIKESPEKTEEAVDEVLQRMDAFVG